MTEPTLPVQSAFHARLKKGLIAASALALIAALIHFAPEWLRADPSPESPLRGISRRLFIACAGLSALIATVLILVRPATFDARRIKSILILGVFITSVLLLFLLPPFQGPDEINHWFTALTNSRAAVREREPVLYFLPNEMQAAGIAFYPDLKFNPTLLRSTPVLGGKEETVGYANRLTYPAVIAVSLFFPRVQSLHEALLFFYLCRFVPLLALCLLLLYLNKTFDLPYTAICFFSLPLVIQQFTIVSSDTIINFGTLAIVLLYERLTRKTDWLTFAALLVACTVVAGNKPVLWGLYSTLLVFVPYARIPRKAIVLPITALAAAVVVCLVARYVGTRLIEGRLNDDALLQSQALLTRHGLYEFLSASRRSAVGFFCIANWAGPLGWLDTGMSGHPLALIEYSFYLCVLLDAAWYVQRFRALRPALKQMALAAAVVVFHGVTLALSIMAIMFIVSTPPHARNIYGSQMRYLFPAVILALILPLIALPRGTLEQQGSTEVGAWRAHSTLALNALAAGFLPLIFFARGVELFVDLVIRFW